MEEGLAGGAIESTGPGAVASACTGLRKGSGVVLQAKLSGEDYTGRGVGTRARRAATDPDFGLGAVLRGFGCFESLLWGPHSVVV